MARSVFPVTQGPEGSFRTLLVKAIHNEYTDLVIQPLGVMYLSSYLKHKGYPETRILDQKVQRLSFDDIERYVREWRPGLVGVSALTWEANAAHEVARRVKSVDPAIAVVFGGPHASSYTETILEDPNVDVVCVGEGEETLLQLVQRAEKGEPLTGVAGIAFRQDGAVVKTEPMPFLQELDELPYPDYEGIDIDAYLEWWRPSRTGSGRYMGLFTSRACPYSCNYCHNIFGKTFRQNSPEYVVDQLEYLGKTYGIHEFEIVDDIFNLNAPRAKAIADLIVKRGLKIQFTLPNGIRGDLMDEELIVKLKRAGLVFVCWAIETASPRLQKKIRKFNKLEKIAENIAFAAREGIYSNGFFMLGFPTETREELQMTIDFALSSKLHSASIFAVNPFEGTALAEEAKALGKETVQDFDMNYFSEDCINLTEIPKEELIAIRRRAVRQFYMNPRRLYRILRDFPNRRNIITWQGAMALTRRIFLRAG
jgi:anaerobic magnesium-protoporphyrin IX monomethyl ester cyclase